MKTKFDPQTKNVRLVEAEAFRAGSNGVAPDTGKQEIEASFERRKAEVREEATGEIKALEARAQILGDLSQEAQVRWKAIHQNHANDIPRLLMPLLWLPISVFAITAEAYLIGPMLDMLGIADPTHQLWTAAAIVTIAAIIFHHFLEARETGTSLGLPLGLAAPTLVGLTVLGVMRAHQLAFAETIAGNPLGRFLQEHPWLGGCLFVFLTLFFPISAALALHKGTSQLHAWWQFRKARRQARRLTGAAQDTQKAVESKREQLEHRITQLEQRAEEWKASYSTFHALGVSVGAKRRPRWTIWAKATAVALLVFVITMCLAMLFLSSLTPMHLVLGALLSAAVWIIAAVHYYRRWEHPSPGEYLKLANLQFREGGMSSSPITSVALSQKPLVPSNLLPQPASSGDGHAREVPPREVA